ncbi:MAG: Ldh family oxidoreductase [Chloroflexota bacterium]|nr:Ldh family oxidoreductase [Chloroflexota bacterium]
MNRLPPDGIPVPAPALRDLVRALSVRAGLPEDKANLLAELLVSNDLRGVFSHGSRQIATYARLMRDGMLNPRPQVAVVNESPATLLLDGDAGLGYFPSWQAAQVLVEKARAVGVAAGVTRHHGHFGAAGLYTRVAAAAGLIGYDTSGVQLKLEPGMPLLAAAGGSPMSFAVPSGAVEGRGGESSRLAGEQPPLVLDFGAIHDLYNASTERLTYMMEHLPSTLMRSFGLGALCQVLGGFLAGVPLDESRAVRRYPGANQGALFVFIDPARFINPATLRQEMDAYHRTVAQLEPFPETGDRATLPGRLEWERERQWAETGVPVGSRHRDELEKVAAEFDVPVPW